MHGAGEEESWVQHITSGIDALKDEIPRQDAGTSSSSGKCIVLGIRPLIPPVFNSSIVSN
jgi:hypothetical protein